MLCPTCFGRVNPKPAVGKSSKEISINIGLAFTAVDIFTKFIFAGKVYIEDLYGKDASKYFYRYYFWNALKCRYLPKSMLEIRKNIFY